MKKLSLFLSLFFLILIISQPVSAQCSADQQLTDIGCINKTNNPLAFASDIYSIGLGFIGGVALISILVGAYQILTSQGDPAKLQNGKSYIVYAIIGLVLALGGFAFYRIIAANVLRIPGFR